jgi:hypothetical protein
MSLSTDEKAFLRLAVCAGAFNSVLQQRPGSVMFGQVSPDLLAAVDALPDESVRQVLRSFQAAQVVQITGQITSKQADVAAAQANLASVQAVVIAPPPASSASGASTPTT